jgi:hypothetical protein
MMLFPLNLQITACFVQLDALLLLFRRFGQLLTDIAERIVYGEGCVTQHLNLSAECILARRSRAVTVSS